MTKGVDTRVGRQPWSETRFGRVVLFLGIVWSIAGAFLVLQSGLVEFVDQAVRAGWISPTRTASAPQPVMDARCAGTSPGVEPSAAQNAPDAAQLRGARYAAWQVGKGFGMAAGA